MKFTCEKSDFLAAVTVAAKGAAAKSTIPALEGILIEAGHRIKLSGYDLKKGVITSFDGTVLEMGSIVLNSKMLGEIIRSLPDTLVSFQAEENNAVTITAGASVFHIMGSDAEEYPEIPSIDHGSSLVIRQEVLKNMINQTNFAVSDNESRPIQTGTLFETQDEILTMVAVDGYRLALRREGLESADETNFKFVVPGSALSDVEKLLSNPDDEIRILVGARHVSFSVENTVLISRRLEGEFLDYNRAIPKEFKYTFLAKNNEVMHAVERVSLIIEDRVKNPIRCRFQDDEILFSCVTALGRAQDHCTVKGSCDGLEIGFNNRFLLDALRAAPCDECVLSLNTSVTPCVITPADGSDAFLYMILPVRIKSGE